MKIYIKTIIAGLCLAILYTGCSDYLDVPINGAITQGEFYKTDEDANSAIAAAYDMLAFDLWNNSWASPVVMKSIISDCALAGGPNEDDQPGYQEMDNMTHTPSNDKIAALWGLNFFGIHRCNIVLDNVANDTPFKGQVLAEAKALRAYFYLDLVTHFGAVPLITTTQIGPNPEEFDIANAPIGDIYAQIEADLSDAIPSLPNKSEQSNADKFRISKGTAQALLGKARLFQGNYSGALSSLEDVINSGEYSLASDYSQIFSNAGEFGEGSLLEGVYADNVGLVGGTAPWGDQRLFDTNMHVQLTGPRGGDFFTDPMDIDFVTGWGFNYPTQKLADTYDAAGDTFRKNATILTEADFTAAGGTIIGDPYDYEGHFRLKYGTRPSEQGDGDGFLNYGTNWRLLRYADVLLCAAEAAAFAGDEGKARDYLNMVRQRAQIADSNAAGTALVTDIQNERFMELAFEGFRFHDLVRWGIAADNITDFESPKHELLPIPAGELARTSNLIQNTGW